VFQIHLHQGNCAIAARSVFRSLLFLP
jgi:hypothetical protein